MDQILILKNPRFEKIFGLEDEENLYKGLNTKMFEIYIFKKLRSGGMHEFEVLDSAD